MAERWAGNSQRRAARRRTRSSTRRSGSQRRGARPTAWVRRPFIPRRIGAEDAALDRAVVGERLADPVLSTAYRALTAELTERIAFIAAQDGRHRAS